MQQKTIDRRKRKVLIEDIVASIVEIAGLPPCKKTRHTLNREQLEQLFLYLQTRERGSDAHKKAR